jgi:23S rRNA pseudouridine1911/1915/1917 synthase
VSEPTGAVWPVPAALEGERLDRALALITGLSRREINEVIDAGRVRIGRRPVMSHSRRVHTGEKLLVEGAIEPAAAVGLEPDAGIDFRVVYSDEAVIVVDKPAGLVVHPGNGNWTGTLVHGLLARFPDLAPLAGEDDTADRPGIVHRLDKGTSGLMVVARTADARDDLIAQLARRSVSREYIALLVGAVDSDAGLIDAPLGRSDTDPSRIRVQAGGREARTRYSVEARYAEPRPTTLVRCKLETGRTHQIRVHFASIGHPVVGDDRYGGRSRTWWPDRFDAFLAEGRPFLHAAALGFEHPLSREALHFSAALPEDLANLLASIGPGANPQV